MGARNGQGRRLRFFANWAWDSVTLPVPESAADVLTGERLAAGESLALGAWDLRVLEQT